MSQRTVLFVQRGSFEPAFQVATLAVTAVAMGEGVMVVFAFEALERWVRGDFGSPANDRERAEWERSQALGLPAPTPLLHEARALGARFVACGTTMKVCGFTEKEVEGRLDEVMGLPSLWRWASGARVLTF